MLPPPKHAHAPFDFGPLQDMNFADTFMLSSELKVPEGTSKEGEEGEESETANGAVDVEDDFAREDAMWVHERRREHCVMTLSCITFFSFLYPDFLQVGHRLCCAGATKYICHCLLYLCLFTTAPHSVTHLEFASYTWLWFGRVDSYQQALDSVLRGEVLMQTAKILYERPIDYYAEMVKTDGLFSVNFVFIFLNLVLSLAVGFDLS